MMVAPEQARMPNGFYSEGGDRHRMIASQFRRSSNLNCGVLQKKIVPS
jgi:hypothetical protein